MTTAQSLLGAEGEKFAVQYLEEKKYKIIGRNVRQSWGELDIVARAPDKTLVLVEVKTMSGGALRPEDQMSAAKMKKFSRAASLYAGHHKELVNDKRGWRLDVIAITKVGEVFTANHYENVF